MNKRIKELDLIREIAAITVVISHFFDNTFATRRYEIIKS